MKQPPPSGKVSASASATASATASVASLNQAAGAGRFNILVNIGVLIALFVLDVRDLVYKSQWIGPYDKYAFSATSVDAFHHQPMVLASPRNQTDGPLNTSFQSGFPSFLEACDNITAVSSDPAFVLQFIGRNCRFGSPKPSHPNNVYMAPSIFLVSNMRVDAVAWGSCQLLLPERRPQVCHSAMVLNFLHRYNMEMPLIKYEWMVLPGTPGEEEIMTLLQVINLSSPMHLVVCAAGVELDYLHHPVGRYDLNIFGCGSPNRHASAIVGHFVPQIYDVIGHYLWLTADDLNVLGFHFVVRENCRAFIIISQSDPNDRDTLRLTHTSVVNFSSFGALYVLMLVVDVVLISIHVLTALEMLNFLILPLLSQHASKEELAMFESEDYSSFFSRSLDRSTSIIILTVLTELLSWMSIIPASTIWTWSNAGYAKVQSFLTTVRLWTLLLILMNTMWDVVVKINEHLAYEIARRTYLNPLEMIAVGVWTCYRHQAELFGIGGNKYGVELQRVIDFGSLVDSVSGAPKVAFANTYNEQLEHTITTSSQVLWMLYHPLFQVIYESILILVVVAFVKLVVFHHYCFKPFIKGNTSSIAAEPNTSRVGPTFGNALEALQGNFLPQGKGPLYKRIMNVIPGLRLLNMSHNAARSFMVNHKYERLPLEKMLDTPMRARSLVRDTLEMEIVVGNKLLLRPPIYFDFGMFVRNGLIKTRTGFYAVVEPDIRVSQRKGSVRASANVPL